MAVAASPSDLVRQALQHIRVRGGVSLDFVADQHGCRAARVREADGHKIRFPNSDGHCEAVLINTGGGIAGGDEVAFDIRLGGGCSVTLSSVAAERIYRSEDVPARIAICLKIGAGSSLAWLPHETILSSGARLARRIEAELAEDATATLLDIVVLGRRGMGERMSAGSIDDRWSVRRCGQLVHMEAVRLGGAIDDLMQRPAIGGGAHVLGTLLHIGPDAADRLEAVRTSCRCMEGVDIAASAWDGKLIVRALGMRCDRVRHAMATTAQAILTRRMPLAWGS